MQGLGDVDASSLLRWKGNFSVGRMTASGFLPGAGGRLYAAGKAERECGFLRELRASLRCEPSHADQASAGGTHAQMRKSRLAAALGPSPGGRHGRRTDLRRWLYRLHAARSGSRGGRGRSRCGCGMAPVPVAAVQTGFFHISRLGHRAAKELDDEWDLLRTFHRCGLHRHPVVHPQATTRSRAKAPPAFWLCAVSPSLLRNLRPSVRRTRAKRQFPNKM